VTKYLGRPFGRKYMKIGLQTWGSEGDIRPFLALAGGLSASGHKVSLVVTSVDSKDYSSYGREMDFTITHVGALSYDEKTIRFLAEKTIKSRNPVKQLKTIIEYFFNPVISEMYEASEQLCASDDLVIGHFMHHPLQAAAEKSGKPYVTLTLNHAGIFSKHSILVGVPNIGTWANPFWWKLLRFIIEREFGPEVNKLRKKVHLPPAGNILDMIGRSQLNLVAVSAALCQHQPDWPDHHKVCGFFNLPKEAENWTMPEDLREFLNAGPPPVYITLGSMLSLDPSPDIITETLIQSVLIAGCRAIIQSRWDELPDWPNHSTIFKIQKVPHQHIFPHCCAVVHHGGAGTTHSATLHGCPSVVIEHFLDQPFFAYELRRLRIAPKVLHRRNITAKKLARAIRDVLDAPDMKRRAEELGAFMQKENGVHKAVKMIEDSLVSPGLT